MASVGAKVIIGDYIVTVKLHGSSVNGFYIDPVIIRQAIISLDLKGLFGRTATTLVGNRIATEMAAKFINDVVLWVEVTIETPMGYLYSTAVEHEDLAHV